MFTIVLGVLYSAFTRVRVLETNSFPWLHSTSERGKSRSVSVTDLRARNEVTTIEVRDEPLSCNKSHSSDWYIHRRVTTLLQMLFHNENFPDTSNDCTNAAKKKKKSRGKRRSLRRNKLNLLRNRATVCSDNLNNCYNFVKSTSHVITTNLILFQSLSLVLFFFKMI